MKIFKENFIVTNKDLNNDFKKDVYLNFKSIITDIKFLLIVLISFFLIYGSALQTSGIIYGDDIDHRRFYTEQLMISMGRFTSHFIDKILDIYHYNSFFLFALAIVTFAFSSVILAAIIKTLFKKNITNVQLALISSLFLAFPIVFYIHTFLLACFTVSISYVLTLIAFIYFVNFLMNIKISDLIKCFILMVLVTSLYETFTFIFFQLCLILLIICLILKKEYYNVKTLKVFIFSFIFVLLVVVCESVADKMMIAIFNVQVSEYFDNKVLWFSGQNIFDTFKSLLADIFANYYSTFLVAKSTLFFSVLSLLYALYIVFKSIVLKNLQIFIYGLGAYLAIFTLSFALGSVKIERTLQSLVIFQSFTLALFIYELNNKNIKWLNMTALSILSIVLIWLAQEHSEAYDKVAQKHKYQENIVNNIAKEVNENSFPKKLYYYGKLKFPKTLKRGSIYYSKKSATVKINNKVAKLLKNQIIRNPRTSIYNTALYLDTFTGNQTYINRYFKFFHYDFKKCDYDNAEIIKKAKLMPSYPKKGYVLKYKECTIVKFGK